jgi:formate hydrogenlyase transcriptional activator
MSGNEAPEDLQARIRELLEGRVLLEREAQRLAAENRCLREEILGYHDVDTIIGASASFAGAVASARRVAPTDATVLVSGEPGTGKELIARLIHSASQRATHTCLKQDCSVLPEAELERALFGGPGRRIGAFEVAHGSTLILEEVGALSLAAQARLLRVLQDHEVEAAGGSYTIKVDVRIVATTRRDLRVAVQDGSFREDLYYRLNAFPIELPPLRDRIEDVSPLVHHFARKHAARYGRHVDAIDPGALLNLTRYSWPGNVRELEAVVERSLVLGQGPLLTITPDIFGSIVSAAPASTGDTSSMRLSATGTWRGLPPLESTDDLESTGLHNIQRMHILRVLDATRWVIEGNSGAAVKLGMKPATLRHRMKKLGISRADHRQ